MKYGNKLLAVFLLISAIVLFCFVDFKPTEYSIEINKSLIERVKLTIISTVKPKTVRIHPKEIAPFNPKHQSEGQSYNGGQGHRERQPQRYLTIYPLDGRSGRLGNFCFRYASALGIAKANNMTLVLPDTPLVREMRLYFKITAPLDTELVSPPPAHSYKNISESHWGMFNAKYFTLPAQTNIRLTWVYSQSWKYFYPIEDEVKRQLTFTDSLSRDSRLFVQGVRNRLNPIKHIIGLHVRRGDFLLQNHQKWGYAVANKQFFSKATKYFVDKYGAGNVLFLVTSDDRFWCQHNLEFHGAHARFPPEQNTPLKDLAVLAACDHHIISVGSFGWWAAWLGAVLRPSAEVLYYKDFPTPGSKHARNHNPVDYYLPNWKGM